MNGLYEVPVPVPTEVPYSRVMVLRGLLVLVVNNWMEWREFTCTRTVPKSDGKGILVRCTSTRRQR